MGETAATRRKNMAEKIARDRALQPRLKQEMYQRQAKRNGSTEAEPFQPQDPTSTS